MSGIAGQFFKQFGITVSVQVFFSLLAARFVTPVWRPTRRIIRTRTRRPAAS
jgi:multidrug efflux pump subunit AcrB